MYSEPTTPVSTTYVPNAADLRQAGFGTDQFCQPFPTRCYTAVLDSGNFLVLVPKPGFRYAEEYTIKKERVAIHRINSQWDLLESMAGRGKREVLLTALAS